jgi:hypothetical protein
MKDPARRPTFLADGRAQLVGDAVLDVRELD